MGNEMFQARVKQLRTDKGLSMDQLAKQLGIKKSRVNMWENNGTVPRNDVLLELAKFFDVTTDYLLGNENEATAPERPELHALQRNLSKLNDKDLEKAKSVLSLVFADIFTDTEEEDDI